MIQNKIDKHMKTTKMRPLKRKFGFAKSKLVSRFCHLEGVYITHIKFRQNSSSGSGVIILNR